MASRGHQPEFSDYYSNLKRRMLFSWVDIQKRRVLRRVFGAEPRMSVLDAGCGAAGVSSVLVPQHQVYGVDPVQPLLDIAAARGLVVSPGTADQLPFPDGRFDAVIMVDVLEHTESRALAIQEVLRVLRPGGLYLTIVPNYSSPLWVFAEKVANWIMRTDQSGHISPFTRESLAHVMSKNFEKPAIGTLNFSCWLWATGRKPQA